MNRVFVVMLILCLMFTTNLGNRAMAHDGEANVGALLVSPTVEVKGFDVDYLDNGYVDIEVNWPVFGGSSNYKDLKLTLIRNGKEENSISISGDEKTYALRSLVTVGETYSFQVKIKGKQKWYQNIGFKWVNYETVSNVITVDDVPPVSDPKPVDFEVTDVTESTISLKWEYSPYWYVNNFFEFIIVNGECVIPQGVKYEKNACEEYGSTRNQDIKLNNLDGTYEFRVMPIGADGYVQALSDPIVARVGFSTEIRVYAGENFLGVYEKLPEIVDDETGENIIVEFRDREGETSTDYFTFGISYDRYIGNLVIHNEDYADKSKLEELISAILSLNEQEGREIFSRAEIEEGPTNTED
ncbi:fibronectin type III domain-containing protein [Jeotgalibacillus marinus]|uniref:Fibronectin type III domain-containing protein n=1 Tax=Jeotgalibacillus marinus TaxID=86667 RepID=A0ABV3Q4G2_9BACL